MYIMYRGYRTCVIYLALPQLRAKGHTGLVLSRVVGISNFVCIAQAGSIIVQSDQEFRFIEYEVTVVGHMARKELRGPSRSVGLCLSSRSRATGRTSGTRRAPHSLGPRGPGSYPGKLGRHRLGKWCNGQDIYALPRGASRNEGDRYVPSCRAPPLGEQGSLLPRARSTIKRKIPIGFGSKWKRF